MQRTPGTPLNDPAAPTPAEDVDTPEPADSPSAGSPSSTADEHTTRAAVTVRDDATGSAPDENHPATGTTTSPPQEDDGERLGAASTSSRAEEDDGPRLGAGSTGSRAEEDDGPRLDADGSTTSPPRGDDGLTAAPSAAAEAAASGGEAGRRSWKWTLVFGGVGLVVLLLDQLTKALALAHLTPGEPVNVIGSLLKFNLIRNSGAAFSLGAGYTPYISAVQIIVAIGVVYLSRRLGSAGWALAFGLLFGGAVGNILDRIFRAPSPFHGHVVDFLQTPHWAIFNVADMAVTSAAILLVIQTLRGIRLDGTREPRK
ncbi:signal peptidase II [Kribbella solani]|uniref:Lipoprotein signal peptidase n=1 Tax=Kribbella solani TaxID=236067 RepID=A0A841DUN4_9ACTN|nr:signal peptidase II [Kribbella solani]MBB5979018.1 signal peptidase II [Kribbella solani]